MKVGIAILPKLPLTEFVALGQKCERHGLSLWVPDERFLRDVFVSLSALACNTQTSMLGTGATDPYIRHPLLTAAAMATFDELSGGRAILGIGAGISGFDALDIKRKSPAKAVRDAIDLSRRFWAGEAVSSSSEFAPAKAATLGFSAREIPVFITGRGPMILALGGETADGVIIGHFTSEQGISFAQSHINAGLNKRSPDKKRPEIAVWAYTSVSRDGDAARAAVKPAIGRTISSTREALGILGEDGSRLLEQLDKFGYSRSSDYDNAMRESVEDTLTAQLSISGTPEECVARIREIGKCGVDQVILLPYPAAGMTIPQMSDLIFTDVLPHVKAS